MSLAGLLQMSLCLYPTSLAGSSPPAFSGPYSSTGCSGESGPYKWISWDTDSVSNHYKLTSTLAAITIEGLQLTA